MTDLILLPARSFEGAAELTPIVYRGKPAFLLPEVERALGYEASSVTKKLRDEWAAEFEEGEEFEKLVGEDLATLKRLLPDKGSSPVVGERAPSLTLLYEPGFNLVCIKTEKPAGSRLRRFIAREVLPSIRKTGSYGSQPDSTSQAEELRKLAAELGPGRLRGRALRLALDVMEASIPRPAPPARIGRPPRPRDPWQDRARALLADRRAVTVPELLGLLAEPVDITTCTRASEVLHAVGWRAAGGSGAVPRVYHPKCLRDLPPPPTEEDPWLAPLRARLEGVNDTTTADAAGMVGGAPDSRAVQQRIATILRTLGFQHRQRRRFGGKHRWRFLREDTANKPVP